MAGSSPIGIRIRHLAEANVVRHVMAGRVPAIRRATGAGGDGRYAPGHDVLGTVPPAKVCSSNAASLMRMGSSPAMTTGVDPDQLRQPLRIVHQRPAGPIINNPAAVQNHRAAGELQCLGRVEAGVGLLVDR